jgi:uncharacterized protein YbjT (DUF2867 family)
MSEPRTILLAGATGLVGTKVMEASREQPWARVIALTRREAPMPQGARMEMLVADPADWPQAVAGIAPDAVICALGTTMRIAGSEEAFRAVDHDLVLTVANAAKDAGVANFVLVSSVGADPNAKAFYLRVKGEVEAAVTKVRLRRLDIFRPGLLRGARGGERRTLERLGIVASPLADLFMHGDKRRFRSIRASVVAEAALQCAREKAQGRYLHDNDSIHRFARRLEGGE